MACEGGLADSVSQLLQTLVTIVAVVPVSVQQSVVPVCPNRGANVSMLISDRLLPVLCQKKEGARCLRSDVPLWPVRCWRSRSYWFNSWLNQYIVPSSQQPHNTCPQATSVTHVMHCSWRAPKALHTQMAGFMWS